MFNHPSCFINPANIGSWVKEESHMPNRAKIWQDRAERTAASKAAYVRYVDHTLAPLIDKAAEMWQWHAENNH